MVDERNFEKPIVSVIIPTFNRPQYLKDCIDSVLKQTYQNFEVLVVDNSSEDFVEKNKEVSLEFNDSRLKYFRIGEENEAQEARLFGVKKSKGKFFGFLDDDDIWVPGKLEKQLNVFDENTGLVSCFALNKAVEKNFSGRESKESEVQTFIYTDLLKQYRLGTASTFLVLQDAFNEVNGFDVDFPAAIDHDFGLRIAQHYTVKMIPLVLVERNAPEGHTSSNFGKRIRGHICLYRRHGKNFKKLGVKTGVLLHLKMVGWLSILFFGLVFGFSEKRIEDAFGFFRSLLVR